MAARSSSFIDKGDAAPTELALDRVATTDGSEQLLVHDSWDNGRFFAGVQCVTGGVKQQRQARSLYYYSSSGLLFYVMPFVEVGALQHNHTTEESQYYYM